MGPQRILCQQGLPPGREDYTPAASGRRLLGVVFLPAGPTAVPRWSRHQGRLHEYTCGGRPTLHRRSRPGFEEPRGQKTPAHHLQHAGVWVGLLAYHLPSAVTPSSSQRPQGARSWNGSAPRSSAWMQRRQLWSPCQKPRSRPSSRTPTGFLQSRWWGLGSSGPTRELSRSWRGWSRT